MARTCNSRVWRWRLEEGLLTGYPGHLEDWAHLLPLSGFPCCPAEVRTGYVNSSVWACTLAHCRVPEYHKGTPVKVFVLNAHRGSHIEGSILPDSAANIKCYWAVMEPVRGRDLGGKSHHREHHLMGYWNLSDPNFLVTPRLRSAAQLNHIYLLEWSVSPGAQNTMEAADQGLKPKINISSFNSLLQISCHSNGKLTNIAKKKKI